MATIDLTTTLLVNNSPTEVFYGGNKPYRYLQSTYLKNPLTS